MPFYGTLESLLEYAPGLGYLALPEADEISAEPGSLESFLAEKVCCLADILADIRADIRSRASLSMGLTYQIYRHYLYVKYYVLKLEQWPIDGSRAIEQRRNGLEKQLDALKQEKRAEQVKCWQDVAKLREEFRRWSREYRELRLRVSLALDRKT